MDDNKNVNNEATNPTAPAFDYDKIASILDSRQRATEESVLKGYFKDNGLTGDEMSQAIKLFKEDRAAKTPDINALNQQIAEANQRALDAEIKLSCSTIASELGVSSAKVPYLIKMADKTNAVKDGKIDKSKLKESLEAVLKDIPELKGSTTDEHPNGFKIGSNNENNRENNNPDALNAQLAQAFGVKVK